MTILNLLSLSFVSVVLGFMKGQKDLSFSAVLPGAWVKGASGKPGETKCIFPARAWASRALRLTNIPRQILEAEFRRK